MTRTELLARRAVLVPIYGAPNDAHELQHVEVTAELEWITEQLRTAPADALQRVTSESWARDGRALAAGRG